MKVTLKLVGDSDNSYRYDVTFSAREETVLLELDNGSRTLEFNKSDLLKTLKLLSE